MPRAMIVAIFLLGALSGCSGQVATATTGPTGAPGLMTPFRSVRHGYELAYPPDWTVTAAVQPWIFGRDGDEPGGPTVDQFQSPGDAAFVVSSQAIPKGTTDDAWYAAYLGSAGAAATHPECFPPHGRWEPIKIDGHAGGVHGGLSGCNFTEAVAIVSGRAYVFTAYANVRAPSSDTFDRTLFDTLLSTIRFHPEAVNDTPGVDPAPS